MNHSFVSRIRPRADQGFALVVTISLMLLLSLLVVGMLELASVSLRSSQSGFNRQQAQANARMALLIAIGEIQQHLGPDQRVSAESSILGEPGQESSVAHPRWVSVWRTTEEDGSPFIRRTAEDGGLRDTRVEKNWDPEDEREAVLVSGNEAQIQHDALGEAGEGAMITMVNLGRSAADFESVQAPLVEIEPGSGSSSLPGQYGWWVGDLGVRANVATVDPFEDREDRSSQLRRTQIAQDTSMLASEAGRDLRNAERARLLTPGQLDLVENSGDSLHRRHFFDYTTDSQSLFVNVRDGGLKKDLTPFLAGNGVIPPLDPTDTRLHGLRESDNLIGPRDAAADRLSADAGQAMRLARMSPTFALLRDWAQRDQRHFLGDISVDSEVGPTRSPRPEMFSYGDHNQRPVRYFQRGENDVSPVLVEGSIYYNLSYYPTGEPAPRNFGLRLHLYPRVSLWNPFNFNLKVPASMIALQVNGGKQVEVSFKEPVKFQIRDRFGRPTSIEVDRLRYDMSWGNLTSPSGGFQRWRRGSHYFSMDPVTIPPGETVVFSPAANANYDEVHFNNNRLSPGVPPDPSRGFYLDRRRDGDPLFNLYIPVSPEPPGVFFDNYIIAPPQEWREFVDTRPIGDVQSSGYTQADDYFMYWKPIDGASGSITLDRFNNLPHGQYVSCAYQYGDEDELPVEWSAKHPVPMPRSLANGTVSEVPDRRTRDGFRLRWFNEHPSNRLGGGSLAGTPHLESAVIANWNIRNSYAFRSPFENVSDVAPHFFSAYTRDLFDQEVDWLSMNPIRGESGRFISDPFNPPYTGAPARVLFDVPRSETGIISLGAFQHVKFSEFIWHPTYAFGNSIADPRMPLDRTEPRRSDSPLDSQQGGWNKDTIGWSRDGRSNSGGGGVSNQENWARHARGLLEEQVQDQTVMFDLSYELNDSLWDEYFLSSGSAAAKARFLSSPSENPLPNGRIRLLPGELRDRESGIRDFHRAARYLSLDGGFNVNSTNPQAWEALLLSSAGAEFGDDKVAFPRLFDAPGGSFDGTTASDPAAWSGTRVLSKGEVRRLAEAIVEEVKRRGPFLSMADFVNRRLEDGELGKKGALQAAIDRAGINRVFEEEYPLDNSAPLPDFNHTDNIKEPTRINQTLKPPTTAWGSLGHLTQADVLQCLGPVLTPRSDTFTVRAYGNVRDANGKVLAEAWCEAVVQRIPEPIAPDSTGLNPEWDDENYNFGRRFEVRAFRWLKREEV
jgi:hypothetical protein